MSAHKTAYWTTNNATVRAANRTTIGATVCAADVGTNWTAHRTAHSRTHKSTDWATFRHSIRATHCPTD